MIHGEKVELGILSLLFSAFFVSSSALKVIIGIAFFGLMLLLENSYPLIDANMKELSTTGFMSNRGRQVILMPLKFQNISYYGI